MDNTNVSKTLARLAAMNGANTKTKGTTVKYFRAKAGKNNLLLLPTRLTGDPFMEWHTHKNLLEKAWMDIQCDKNNKAEECLICQVVEDLQKQDWKGNYPLWKPLEVKTRYYSYVIDLDNISDGIQLWGYGKSVLAQFENWLLNLEEGEEVFYSIEEPQKILVSYTPTAEPANMYKLDKKPVKPFPLEQIEAWQNQIRPLKDVFGIGKSKQEITEALDAYMERMKDIVASTQISDESEEIKPSASTKLNGLKGGK